MASLNQCNFIGNVGKIETRYLSSGDPVVNLSLACNEYYKDKNGDKQEKTEWINVTIYGKLAGITGEYVSKGRQIYISGRMSTRKWTDKNGVERYTTEIIAKDMKLLGGLSKDDSNRRDEQPRNQKESFSDDTDIPF